VHPRRQYTLSNEDETADLYDEISEEYDPEEDLMDVPDFFFPGRPRTDELPEVEVSVLPPPTRAEPRPRYRVLTDSGRKGRPQAKLGVKLPTNPIMQGALRIAQSLRNVITSGREGFRGDGVHGQNSLHYDGLAVDVRPTSDRARQINAYADAGYNVLDEGNHLHVSVDPRGQRV